jgi:hypothetical protein
MWLIIPAALFLASVAVTQPPYMGDSMDYIDDIHAAWSGSAAHETLWEFGHILWRPLGYWFSSLFVAFIPNGIAWTPQLKIFSGLMLFSLIAGLAGTLLIYTLSRRLSGSRLAAVVASMLFVWGDAVLAYSQTATPYIPALALLLAGLCWQLTSFQHGRSGLVGPACLFGVAALFWFPFAMAIPAASCAGRFIRLPGGEQRGMSWRQCILSCAIAVAVLFAGIMVSAWLAGIRSVPEAVSWVASSGHGTQQNRRWLRAISGFSRLLIDLDQEGVYLKRLVFRDPFYPETVIGAFRSGLWKVGAFYSFIAGVVYLAWRSAERKSCIPLAIGFAAGVFAAVVVFEPSSPERLLPVLPFLVMALSAGWRSSWRWAAPLRAGIGVFVILLAMLNFPNFEWRRSAGHRQAQAQADDFRKHAQAHDLMLVTTMSEPVVRLLQTPFDPVNRLGAIRYSLILNPIDNKDAAAWRRIVAHTILRDWGLGNNVWVMSSVLFDRPNKGSLWTEGDNPAVHWRDVPAFFRTLEFDAETSAGNGFARLRRSPANRERLARE